MKCGDFALTACIIFLLGGMLVIFHFNLPFKSKSPRNKQDFDGIIGVSAGLMVILGFALISSRNKKSFLLNLISTLLSACFAMILFLFFSVIFLKLNLSNRDNQFATQDLGLTMLNDFNNQTQSLTTYPSVSVIDSTTCAIATIISIRPIINFMQIKLLLIHTIMVSIGFVINFFLFNRLFIADFGYGMRCILFGSFYGLITSTLLRLSNSQLFDQQYNENLKQIQQNKYKSYQMKNSSNKKDEFGQIELFNLLGSIFIITFYPVIASANYFSLNNQSSQTEATIQLTIWISIIGCFAALMMINMSFPFLLTQHEINLIMLTGLFANLTSCGLQFKVAYNLMMAVGIVLLISLIKFIFKGYSGYQKRSSSFQFLEIFILPIIISMITSSGVLASDSNSERNPSLQIAGFGITIGISGILAIIHLGWTITLLFCKPLIKLQSKDIICEEFEQVSQHQE